ncbi:hypothetical protein B4U80_14259 [Leptotrombidium deliense]|uniref:Endonuclease/exonuclease/phosphatase domain-containing protein n=1 Tax=Leptotrombidium deliense TaxID=299467 RepID=A0A443RZ40_9ACAR|nr:hypothetical protein B4U80_14259 [Leptotrombidium deliense]
MIFESFGYELDLNETNETVTEEINRRDIEENRISVHAISQSSNKAHSSNSAVQNGNQATVVSSIPIDNMDNDKSKLDQIINDMASIKLKITEIEKKVNRTKPKFTFTNNRANQMNRPTNNRQNYFLRNNQHHNNQNTYNRNSRYSNSDYLHQPNFPYMQHPFFMPQFIPLTHNHQIPFQPTINNQLRINSQSTPMYQNIPQNNLEIPRKQNNVKCFYANVHSIKNKAELLQSRVLEESFDIDRTDNYGGVLIAVKNHLTAAQLNLNSAIEHVVLKTKINNTQLILVCIYLPPPITNNTINDLKMFLHEIYNVKFQNEELIICGDFNA